MRADDSKGVTPEAADQGFDPAALRRIADRIERDVTARRYDGVFCFQLRLEDDDEALSLPEGQYHFTMAFRDPGTNEVVAAKTVAVAGFPHTSTKAAPAEGSSVAKDLLGCPRTVI